MESSPRLHRASMIWNSRRESFASGMLLSYTSHNIYYTCMFCQGGIAASRGPSNILNLSLLVGSLMYMQGETAERILQTANLLLIDRGYSAFSYADIAEAVKIRKASIHHHFPTKAGLVVAVLRAHRQNIAAAMGRLDKESYNPLARIRNYCKD